MPRKYDFDVRPLRVPVIIVKRRTIDLSCLLMTGIKESMALICIDQYYYAFVLLSKTS